jgi:hypothetical protein
MGKPMTLEERVVVALATTDFTSVDLGHLIAEVDTAIVAVSETAIEEREKALDPAISPDPKKARQAMEDAEFTVARLKTVLPRLQVRWQEIAMAESLAAWKRDFETVRAERDATAEEFAEIYPAAVERIVDLMTRVADVDKKVQYINRNAPPGAHYRLREVELEARGIESFTQPHVPIPTALRLPIFDCSHYHQFAWPPRVPSLAETCVFPPAMFVPLDMEREREEANRRRREETARLNALYEERERKAEQCRKAELREAASRQQ